MANNSQVAPIAEAPQSAFSTVLAGFGTTVFNGLNKLLETRIEGEATRLQAKQDLETQQIYNELSRSNHATNDPADATKAATEQTVLLFGFLPVSRAVAPVAMIVFVAVGALIVFALARAVRR